MGLLDEVISNTGYKDPIIVSEQHNVNNIDVGSGGGSSNKLPSDRLKSQLQSISSGGWDASEYGRSREQQVVILTESLNKALEFEKTPEGIEAARVEAEKTLLELRNRAIRRASLDTSNGKISVFTAGVTPWHKLGVNVAEAVNSADAARLANIDWMVDKRPLTYTDETGTVRTQNDVWGIVRRDTGAFLGSVGSRYKEIQNSAGFAFLDSCLEKFGAKYESAGACFGGKVVWMLAKLPQQQVVVGGKDVVEAYALFQNPHDGSGVATCVPTSVRVVCSNTLRIATGQSRGKGIGIRHTGNLEQKIVEAQKALGIAVEGFKEFGEKAEVLAKTQVDCKNYFRDVLDAALDVTEAQCLLGADVLAAALKTTEANMELVRKSFANKIERRGEILEEILERYESDRCGTNGIRGTAYAAMNAVTEFCDHGKLKQRESGSVVDRNSRKFESVLTGEADTFKQVAYETALNYAGI